MSIIKFEVENPVDLELLEILGARLGLNYEIEEVEATEVEEKKEDYLFGKQIDQKTLFETLRDMERRERRIDRDYDPNKVPF